MITFAKTNNSSVAKYSQDEINQKFLQMLPLIARTARMAFEDFDPDRREDAVQDVIAGAYFDLCQLAAKGKLEDAYATPLAWFRIFRYRTGRRAGIPQMACDVMGERCKFLGRSRIINAGLCESIADTWESEATATDSRYPVPKQVAFKIDFHEWFSQLSPKDKNIVKDLAMSETTGEVAKKYQISQGRISQFRREYANSWYSFINSREDKEDLIEALTAAAEALYQEEQRAEA
jgi:hypothetical protein